MEYTLTKTKRKTIALYIRNGKLEVKAPQRATKKQIETFIHSKAAWINEKLTTSINQQQKREAFTLNYGDNVLLLGQLHPIISAQGKPKFDNQNFCIPQGLNPTEIKDTCIKIYRTIAKEYLTNRTLEIAKTLNLTPTTIKINGAYTRWGSCSSLCNINFSWRLIMADPETIDYVITHELAHLQEMNHSPKFWAILENALPNYKQHKQHLKQLQKTLATQNW